MATTTKNLNITATFGEDHVVYMTAPSTVMLRGVAYLVDTAVRDLLTTLGAGNATFSIYSVDGGVVSPVDTEAKWRSVVDTHVRSGREAPLVLVLTRPGYDHHLARL